MVKKYKLSGSDIKNQKAGSHLNFIYPVVPNMTGLIPSNQSLIKSNIMMGNPYMPGYNGSYIRSDRNGGLKLGMPLVNANGDGMRMVIPPRYDPRDPSVFVGVESPKPPTGEPIKNVNLTFKEAMPKQSIVMYQPTLPMLPNPYGMQLPVGLVPGAPIVINPTESKSRMEITSNESDDIITISGEQDKIKPVFEGIQKYNKVKMAQDEVTLAKKAFIDAIKLAYPGNPDSAYINMYTTNYKPLSISVLEAMDNIALPLSFREQLLRLKKAQNALKIAKKEATLADNDNDVSSTDLIPLDTLFDLTKVTNMIKSKFSLTNTDFDVKSSKKNSLQILLGLPYRNGFNYGPAIF